MVISTILWPYYSIFLFLVLKNIRFEEKIVLYINNNNFSPFTQMKYTCSFTAQTLLYFFMINLFIQNFQVKGRTKVAYLDVVGYTWTLESW